MPTQRRKMFADMDLALICVVAATGGGPSNLPPERGAGQPPIRSAAAGVDYVVTDLPPGRRTPQTTELHAVLMVDPVARPDARPADDDARLLARLVAGDERALGSLYDSYGAVVYGLALAITQDPPTAESVVTDAFADVWREARSFQRPGATLFAWLSHTVRSLALARRAPSARASAAQPPAASELALALDRLAPVERQSVELAYFGGLSRSEIARALGETEVTVAVALRTAMERLRDLVTPPSSHVTPRMVANV